MRWKQEFLDEIFKLGSNLVHEWKRKTAMVVGAKQTKKRPGELA